MTSSPGKFDSQFSSDIYNHLFYGILLIGLGIRVICLNSDPPVDLAKGQSLWTDPSQYVFFARNFVVFGNMDLFAPSNLTFFKYSLISFISIPIFLIFGSGYWQSNFVSILLSFSGIIIFSHMVKRAFGKLAGIIAATFASSSYIYIMHNRVPYLENASITLIVISSYILIFEHQGKVGLSLSGFIYSSSVLMGKTLAVMVFPAFIITIWSISQLRHEQKKLFFRMAYYFSLGMLIFAILAFIAFYLPNFISSKEYLYENVISYYGFPDGLKSIPGFIKALFTFDLVNFENGYFDRMPIITLCCILYFIFISRERVAYKKAACVFFGAWLIFGYLFLSPWNYRPIRYEIYLFLPMVALASIFIQNLILRDIKLIKSSFFIALFLFSLVSFHIYFKVSDANIKQYYPFWKMLVLSILISTLVSMVVYTSLKYVVIRRYYVRITIVIGIMLLSLVFDAMLYIKWLNRATFAIDYVNRNLPRQIDKDAIIIGPYAQTVTLGNNIKSEIYYFGAYARNDSLFESIPVTHVIYETGMGGKSGNELKFQEYYPRIKAQATIIDTYLIGRYYINIYNITDATANARSHAYHWSNFEKAMKYYGESNVDSALRYFEKAVNEDRFSRASLYRGNLYFGRGQYEQAREEYRIGLEDDCYDPKYWILYSVACKRTGQLTESERARKLAFKYEPYAGFINNLKF